MAARDLISKKLDELSKLDPYSVLKSYDKVIAEKVLGTKFEPDAWYYDSKKVREYIAKNRP